MLSPRAPALAIALAAALGAGCGRGDLDSPDATRRAAAVRGLSADERSLAVLLVAQRDASPLVRTAAAERLSESAGAAQADALGRLLVDPSPEVAAAAARGLAGMPNEPRARQLLVAAYAGATPGGRAAIAEALDRLGVSLREAVEAEARVLWERNVAVLEARGPARAGAAEELGASGRADALQRLVPLLEPARSGDRTVAAAAARGLGESAEWTARPHLEALLADSDAALAEAAASALGRLGDPRAADALARAGAAETARIGAATVDALAALPDAAEVGVALCDLAIRSADATVAGRAARMAQLRDAACPERPFLAKLGRPGTEAGAAALGELGLRGGAAQAVADRLLPLVERGADAAARASAATALARLGTPAGAAAIERRLQALVGRLAERRTRWLAGPSAPGAPPEWIDPVSPDDVLETAALLAVAGRLRAASAEAVLLAHACDPRPRLRAGAVEGLAALASAPAFEAVVAALKDPDGGVRAAAAEGLGRAGAAGARPLIAATKEPESAAPEFRIVLARALGETGSAEAVPTLAALLDGPSAEAAAAALGRIGAPAATEHLVSYLGRGEASARAEAIEALAQLAARDAAPAIAALLTDDRPDVRASAARSLGRLRHEPASARLEALRSDYYGRVRRAAVEALAKLPSGVPRARR